MKISFTVSPHPLESSAIVNGTFVNSIFAFFCDIYYITRTETDDMSKTGEWSRGIVLKEATRKPAKQVNWAPQRLVIAENY